MASKGGPFPLQRFVDAKESEMKLASDSFRRTEMADQGCSIGVRCGVIEGVVSKSRLLDLSNSIGAVMSSGHRPGSATI